MNLASKSIASFSFLPSAIRYKTDSQEHAQRGILKNNELSIVGAYTVYHPEGYVQMTMYVADKDGFKPQITTRFDSNLLKSAVG